MIKENDLKDLLGKGQYAIIINLEADSTGLRNTMAIGNVKHREIPTVIVEIEEICRVMKDQYFKLAEKEFGGDMI